ncbi:hypothetical protein KEM56_000677 [Ascosphaera pollenicola]|nr:hypothetical protein KEM56_000677 [Ascosphaera pollenicola]
MKLNAVLAVTSVFAASAAAAPAPVPQGKGQWIGGVYYDGHQAIPTYVDQNGHPVQPAKRSVFEPTGLPMKRRDDIDGINGQPDPNVSPGASMAAQVPRRDDLSNLLNSITVTKTINSEALEAEISDLKNLFERRSSATAPAATAAVENNDADLRKRDWSSPAGFGKRSMTTEAVTQANPPGSHNSGFAVQYFTYDNGKRAVRDAMTTPAPPDSPIKRYATRLDNGHWVDIQTDRTLHLAGPGPMSTHIPRVIAREAGTADTQLVQRSWLQPTGLPAKRELGDHAKTSGGYGFAERSWLQPTGLPTKRDLLEVEVDI